MEGTLRVVLVEVREGIQLSFFVFFQTKISMRQVPPECDINIAIKGPVWVEVENPEHPLTAMLICSRGTYFNVIGEDLGQCCGKAMTTDCGGYSGGKAATEHYWDGLFGEPMVTTWTRKFT